MFVIADTPSPFRDPELPPLHRLLTSVLISSAAHPDLGESRVSEHTQNPRHPQKSKPDIFPNFACTYTVFLHARPRSATPRDARQLWSQNFMARWLSSVCQSVRRPGRQRGCAQSGDTGRELASSSGRTGNELLHSPHRLTRRILLHPVASKATHWLPASQLARGGGGRHGEREEIVLGLDGV